VRLPCAKMSLIFAIWRSSVRDTRRR
jgi:hypothetical protein